MSDLRDRVLVRPGASWRAALLGLLSALIVSLAAAPLIALADPAPGADWSPDLLASRALGPSGRPINEYPDALLLPPRDSGLVAGLVVLSATTAQRGAADSASAFYQVVLGRSTASGPTTEARFFGTHGASLFPSLGGNPARPADCGASAEYCTDSLFGPGGALTTEVFFGLVSGRGDRAQVTHNLTPNGASWAVVLYRPDTDQVFGFTLHGATADRAGAVDLDPANRALAQQLVDQAAGFEAVTLPRGSTLAGPVGAP